MMIDMMPPEGLAAGPVEGLEDPAALLDRIVTLPRDQFVAALQKLPPEMHATAVELHETLMQERLRQLKDLAERLQKEKLDPIIRAKRPIEQRWAEDDRQYYGFDRRPTEKPDRKQGSNQSSEEAIPPGLNLTASRTNTWTARIVNMVCPGSILPGDITPTPKPEMVDPATGQPMPDAEQVEKAALAAASRMNKTIRDQFAECKVPKQIRVACPDLTRYGTGIMSGPEQRLPRRTKFKPIQGEGFTVYEAVRESRPKPTWRRINLRYFFPEMVEDIADAGYCFELMLLTKRELSDLRKQPGFEAFAEAFEEILNPDYKAEIRGEIATNLTQWNSMSPAKEAIENRLAVWRFFGHIDRKDMEACGHTPAEDDEGASQEPPLMELWFTDGKILRADTLIPDGTTRLPYYVTKLFSVDDTMFGGGIPYAGRDAQASINSLWRAAQHNASVSAGPQIGYQDNIGFPTDGDYRVRGPKTWRITAPDKKIDDMLSILLIPNNAAQYLELLQLRMQMYDEEINLPLIAQGQPDAATPTSTGLTMQMRAASVAILNVGQNCEDGWVTPMFESAYHYNMLHNDDPSIKGDFDCVSRLVSDNVMREIKAQHLLVLSQMKRDDPDLAMRLKPELFYPRLATAMEQDPELFRDEDEVVEAQKKAAENQPQDPKLLMVQLETQKLQMEMEARTRDRELDHIEKMRELDIREREAETREAVASRQLEIKLAELAQSADKTVAEIQASLGIESERERTKQTKIAADAAMGQHKAGMQARIEAEKLAQREAENALEVQVEAPGPRLA